MGGEICRRHTHLMIQTKPADFAASSRNPLIYGVLPQPRLRTRPVRPSSLFDRGRCFVSAMPISPIHLCSVLPFYSIWMKQACPVFRFAHHNAGQAPELRILFNKLSRLHALLTAVVFVFDGANRSLRKRGKIRARTTPHWLENQFRALIKLFGFSVHEV